MTQHLRSIISVFMNMFFTVHSLGMVMVNVKDLLLRDMTFAKWSLTCEVENER